MSSEFSKVNKIVCNQSAAFADVLRVHDYGYLRHLSDFCLKLNEPSEEQRTGIDCDFFDAGDTSVSYFSKVASLHSVGTLIEAVDMYYFFF